MTIRSILVLGLLAGAAVSAEPEAEQAPHWATQRLFGRSFSDERSGMPWNTSTGYNLELLFLLKEPINDMLRELAPQAWEV